MDEITAGFHHLNDVRAYCDSGNRQVTRRKPLRHGDDVRLNAHGFVAPHIASTPKAADDLITDQ